MIAWRRIGRDTVLAINDRQLAQHGGLVGVNDGNLIESALARPPQLNAYGVPAPDVFDLAAADAIPVMLGVAAGTAAERQFADWLRERHVP